jgi:hypothetical protein
VAMLIRDLLLSLGRLLPLVLPERGRRQRGERDFRAPLLLSRGRGTKT